LKQQMDEKEMKKENDRKRDVQMQQQLLEQNNRKQIVDEIQKQK